MKRKFLEDLGLEADVVEKIMIESGKDTTALKAKVDELTEKINVKDTTISEKNNKIAELEKEAPDEIGKYMTEVFTPNKEINELLSEMQIALSSFNKPTIIILGGLERGQDFNELKPYMNNVKGIIGIGQCRDRVLDFGNSLGIPTYSFEHLSDGFDKCVEISDEGDVILLSPASASWDQYKECEIRGREFKDKVKEIKNENQKC